MSFELTNELVRRKNNGIGTIISDRCKHAPLTATKQFKRKKRGYSEFICTSNLKDGNVKLVRWNDNTVVTMATNSAFASESKDVLRYSKQTCQNITVPMPYTIAKYNKSMGGVDLLDQFINCYRIRIRGRKWYWAIWSWLIDACVSNAWVLFKKLYPPSSNKKLAMLDFRRRLALTMLAIYGSPPSIKVLPCMIKLILDLMVKTIGQ